MDTGQDKLAKISHCGFFLLSSEFMTVFENHRYAKRMTLLGMKQHIQVQFLT